MFRSTALADGGLRPDAPVTRRPRAVHRRIVVVPSRALDRWREPAAETRAYEERLLGFLLELRDPSLALTYISSLPIAESTIDYHLSLLPPSLRASARQRLSLVSVGDGSGRPLSEKLLERPSALARVRRTLRRSEQAWIIPYNSTDAERRLGAALGVPVYGADPLHAHLGTKSGGRALFALAGIRHPRGVEHVRGVGAAVRAIGRLRRADPDIGQLVLKLDRGVSGEGNAIVDLGGLPSPGGPGDEGLIEDRVRSLVPDVADLSAAEFLDKLAAQGGVVEERITGAELRSPSVQLDITPAGRVEVLSTHDQILGGRTGQQFAGSRFPADPAYATAISPPARRVAERLAATGFIGRFGIDFVVARRAGGHWDAFAIELNVRMGGTTNPQQTLVGLTGGRYDAGRATFVAPGGAPRHYVSRDHLATPRLRGLGVDELLAVVRRAGVLWDPRRATGAVFHMLCGLDSLGRVGVTAIGRSAEEAGALHDAVEAALSGPARSGRAAA